MGIDKSGEKGLTPNNSPPLAIGEDSSLDNGLTTHDEDLVAAAGKSLGILQYPPYILGEIQPD